MNFEVSQLTGPVAALVILLLIFHLQRQDIITRNQQDREDRKVERESSQSEREKTQQLHKDSITELKESINKMVESHQQVVSTVVKKAEETERLAEKRFELVLMQTLAQKPGALVNLQDKP